jgi:hypothetical protein
VVLLGLYMLAQLVWGIATFRSCPEEADELRKVRLWRERACSVHSAEVAAAARTSMLQTYMRAASSISRQMHLRPAHAPFLCAECVLASRLADAEG